MRFLILSLAATALGGFVAAECPSQPMPPPGADASDAAPPPVVDASANSCALACANLAAIGCKEGVAPNCTSTCDHAQSARLTDLHPDCLARAKTKAEARACRSVVCPE